MVLLERNDKFFTKGISCVKSFSCYVYIDIFCDSCIFILFEVSLDYISFMHEWLRMQVYCWDELIGLQEIKELRTANTILVWKVYKKCIIFVKKICLLKFLKALRVCFVKKNTWFFRCFCLELFPLKSAISQQMLLKR